MIHRLPYGRPMTSARLEARRASQVSLPVATLTPPGMPVPGPAAAPSSVPESLPGRMGAIP